jgi:hypothetical protein
MLDSAVLEVAAGLVFCYASMAIIASSLYEAIASLLKLRARSLLDGVKALLNDPKLNGLASAVYNHALVNPRSAGTTAAGTAPVMKPSYIAPPSFALAVVDAIQKTPGTFAELKGHIDAVKDDQLRVMLQGMYIRAEGKIENLQAQLAGWFDSAMDRVAGGYKRQTQLITFILAFVVAALFNVDTFHMFKVLWQHPVEMAKLSSAAAAATAAAVESPAEVLRGLSALPVGWSGPPESVSAVLKGIPGWLATASSVLFGAPFWFDLLQRLVNLRGTGHKPETKDEEKKK